MRIVDQVIRILDACAEAVGHGAALFAGLMVLVTCHIVLYRYGFDSGSVAEQESIIYMNSLLFILGAGYTLKHNGHVRVDIFYGPASVRAKAWINLLGTLLLLLPVCVFLFWSCWNYVAASWNIREGSPDSGGLPWVYLLKTLLLALPALLTLQGLAELLRNLRCLLQLQPAACLPEEQESTEL